MGVGVSKAAAVVINEEEENLEGEKELAQKTPEERKAELISLVEDLSRDPEDKEDGESFYCAISYGLMVDPVYAVTEYALTEGRKIQIYDRDGITRWGGVGAKDPHSGELITELMEATELKNKILKYRTSTIDKCLDAAEELIAWDEPNVALKALERANNLITLWSDRGEMVAGEDVRRGLLHENYSALIELNFAKFKDLLGSDMPGAVELYEDVRKSAINWQAGDFMQDFAKQARAAHAHCQEKFDEAMKESAALLLQGEVPNLYSLIHLDKLTQDWASHGPIRDETKDERMERISGLCQEIIDCELRDFEQLLYVNQDVSAALELCQTVKKSSKAWGAGNFDHKFVEKEAQIKAYYQDKFSEKMAEFDGLIAPGKAHEAMILVTQLQKDERMMEVENVQETFAIKRLQSNGLCRYKIIEYFREFDQEIDGGNRQAAAELMKCVKDINQAFEEPFLSTVTEYGQLVESRERMLEAFRDPKKMIFEAIGLGDVKLLKLCLAIDPKVASVSPRDESHSYWQKNQLPYGGRTGSYLMSGDIADNNTPLHCPAKRNNKEMCALLIGCGASREVPNDNGKTPQTLAIYHGHKNLFSRIKEPDLESAKQEVEALRKSISVGAVSEEEVTLTMTPRSMSQLTGMSSQEERDR